MDKEIKVSETAIISLHKFPLLQSGRGVVIAHESDHRLRRFGQLEMVDLGPGGKYGPVLRGEADEIWAAIEGAADFSCVDRRDGSPSEAQKITIHLDAADQEGVFIPFGVDIEIKAEEAVRLIRLASHRDGSHANDRILPVDGMAATDPQANR